MITKIHAHLLYLGGDGGPHKLRPQVFHDVAQLLRNLLVEPSEQDGSNRHLHTFTTKTSWNVQSKKIYIEKRDKSPKMEL